MSIIDLFHCESYRQVVWNSNPAHSSTFYRTVGDVGEPAEPGFCDFFTFEDRRRPQDGGEDCTPNILDMARDDPNLRIVVALMESVELDTIFQCSGPFTLLLPTDDAFRALGDNSLEVLRDPDNFNVVQDILLYHILRGAIRSTEFEAGLTETLFTPADVLVSLNPIMFNTASILEADVRGCNGIYHVIDQLLVPGTLLKDATWQLVRLSFYRWFISLTFRVNSTSILSSRRSCSTNYHPTCFLR